MTLRVLPATRHHLLLFFTWASDNQNQQTYAFQEPITLCVYRKWFRKALLCRSNWILVIEGHDPSEGWNAIGQVRCNQWGEIGVLLGEEFRGRHLATPAIETAMAYLTRRVPQSLLFADIQEGNQPSEKAFIGAGFQFTRTMRIGNQRCRRYVYEQTRLPYSNRTSAGRAVLP